MRKATLTLMATMALAIMFALSTAVAMAGWGYDDCPPASMKAQPAQAAWDNWHSHVYPTPNQNAIINPGNK